LDDQHKKLEDQQKKIDIANKKLEDETTTRSKLEKDLESSQKVCQNYKNDLESITAERDELRTKGGDDDSKLSQDYIDLQKKFQDFKKKKENAEDQVSSLQTYIDKQTEKVSKLEEVILISICSPFRMSKLKMQRLLH
jgi:chromosome segregation ATPase